MFEFDKLSSVFEEGFGMFKIISFGLMFLIYILIFLYNLINFF
jgi:hypothetical protein